MLASGIDLGTASLRLPEGVKPFTRRISTLHSRTVMSGVVRVGDVAIVVMACLLAIVGRFMLADMTTPDVVLATGLIGVLASIILFPIFVSYRLDDLTALPVQMPRLLVGWTALILALIGVLFAFKGADLSLTALGRLLVGVGSGSSGTLAVRGSRLGSDRPCCGPSDHPDRSRGHARPCAYSAREIG